MIGESEKMNTTYNTKLTAEQKADLKEYKQSANNTGGVIVFIHNTTIAMLPDGYGDWFIGKAIASKREVKLRAKVGMHYALERAYEMNRIVSGKVFNQILDAAEYHACATACHYGKENDEAFDPVRYL